MGQHQRNKEGREAGRLGGPSEDAGFARGEPRSGLGRRTYECASKARPRRASQPPGRSIFESNPKLKAVYFTFFIDLLFLYK